MLWHSLGDGFLQPCGAGRAVDLVYCARATLQKTDDLGRAVDVGLDRGS
jgi:hypothetical protein